MTLRPIDLSFVQKERAEAVSYIDRTAEWARVLTDRECRESGDTESAMRRLSRRLRIPYSLLWRLRYRRPKGIFWNYVEALRAAYLAECERQMRLLGDELEQAKKLVGETHPTVRAAESFLLKAEDQAAD